MASSFGNNGWQIVALIIGMIILMFGIGQGIEKANRIMMPVFFILFAILGIYVAFQPGAIDGYRYIFRIDPVILANPKTWIFALGQAFFSLSVAGNGTLIYGSYLSDKEDIPAAAGRVALFDTIAALLAAIVIIPAMATIGAQLDQGGPGLMFIYLPALFKSMPCGHLIAMIFFVAVFSAGLSSLINLYEAPIATIQEKLHLGRKTSCTLIAVFSLIVSICIQGIVSDWMDVLSIYICPLGAGLAGIMFFWICGKTYVETQVNKGRNKPFTDLFLPVCKYIYCPLCVLVLILGILLGGIGFDPMSRTNDLGRDEISRLVIRLAIPTMLAQLVNVLYSIVDRMYIGTGVGDLALAGVGICAPIVTLLASFGSMVGQGGAPIMAMKMGSGNEKRSPSGTEQRIFNASDSVCRTDQRIPAQ